MSEQASFIVTITGDDRPGILDDVSGVIQRNSGTIAELRSVDAGGQFAMLITVRLAESAHEALTHQLAELSGYSGLCVTVKPAAAAETRKVQQFCFIARGTDHIGVLKKLSHLLRVLSVNIDDIDTRTEADGEVRLTLTLSVPRECPVSKLKEFLDQLLNPIGMKWELAST